MRLFYQIVTLFLAILLINCSQENTTKSQEPTPKIKTQVAQTAPSIPEKPKSWTEKIQITFPKPEKPVPKIPPQPLNAKELKIFVRNIVSYNEGGDGWLSFGGFLQEWPPDLDGAPAKAKDCLTSDPHENGDLHNYCTWYTKSDWSAGKIFAQLILYNYDLGDQKVAGQIAWFLDNNIPWAKYLVAAWREYFIPRYKDFNFTHKLKICTGWTDEIIYQLYTEDEKLHAQRNGKTLPEYKRDYRWERKMTWIEIEAKTIRDAKGILTNPYQKAPNPLYPGTDFYFSPSMIFADSKKEKELDGLDRAIFFLGPEGTAKACRLLDDVYDILMNHPEKEIPFKY